MKAKTYILYYEDPTTAKHAMHALFDAGIQRDNISFIEGQIPDEILRQPAITLPDEQRSRFQSLLDQGGAMLAAWVMGAWRKRAQEVFYDYPPSKLEELQGRRFIGLRTRT
ncbi:MAG: hypothetical protein GYB64_10255 [Chloroflexi bacterium]|nr:hypothetical protein [Chloroflexota bacterium]